MTCFIGWISGVLIQTHDLLILKCIIMILLFCLYVSLCVICVISRHYSEMSFKKISLYFASLILCTVFLL